MAHDKVSLVGHTKSYHQVLIKGDPDKYMGKRIRVKITETTKHAMKAQIIGEPTEVATADNLQIIREKKIAEIRMSEKSRSDIIAKLTKFALPAVLALSLIYLSRRK